jgi:hypothetical protein
MIIKLTEEQLLNLITEQSNNTGGTESNKAINKNDFENYIKKYEGIKIKDKTISPGDFLIKLNKSPIQLNMYHIQTEGWDIGTGSISATGIYGDSSIRLDLKPVGDYRVALLTLTKTF